MSLLLQQLERWMADPEGERLEFKEAKNNLDYSDLVEYCAAIANEGGGQLILGVTNRLPRRVVGSIAFRDLGKIKEGLLTEGLASTHRCQ